MEPKALTSSKTFWFNVLTLVVTYGGAVTGTLPPNVAQYSVAAVAIANILLRMITKQPVTV